MAAHASLSLSLSPSLCWIIMFHKFNWKSEIALEARRIRVQILMALHAYKLLNRHKMTQMNTNEVSRQSSCFQKFGRGRGGAFWEIEILLRESPSWRSDTLLQGRVRKSHCQVRGHALQLGCEPWQTVPEGYPLEIKHGQCKIHDPTLQMVITGGSIIFNDCKRCKMLQVVQWQRSSKRRRLNYPKSPSLWERPNRCHPVAGSTLVAHRISPFCITSDQPPPFPNAIGGIYVYGPL